ncbi:MAG: cyclase family protein [Chloroflexi bacterium]|nr:cyclase family protein [Chloroflexota bacterium]
MQQFPDVPFPPLHFMIRSGESLNPSRPGTVDYIAMVFHGLTTTHVDALSHSILEGELYGGRPASVVTTEYGATELSIDAMRDGVVTRGILIDVPAALDREFLDPGEPVTPHMLERVEAAEGLTIGEGDALLLRTGWWTRRRRHGPAPGRSRAGLHASALPWLHARGVAVVATDAANDVIPSGYEIELPVHEIGQVAMGLCLIDACDFDRLAEACTQTGRFEFMFAFAPLRMPFATGSPVNPVAVL